MASVYIAGPMRGYPFFNFPAFDRAAELFRSRGWTVYSPADMDRDHPTGDSPPFGSPEVREFMRRDTAVIVDKLKAEDGDAIALLPDWERSTGAKAELALAKWAGLLILNALTGRPLDVKLEGKTLEVEDEVYCFSCADGACPTMGDIVEEQARRIANTAPEDRRLVTRTYNAAERRGNEKP